MRKISQLLFGSNKKEKRVLYIIFALNVAFISIMLMLAFGLNDSTNVSLSDKAQIEVIFSSMIIIAIITISFFLWLIVFQFKGLYHARYLFNRNVRLLGLRVDKLHRLYLKEMLSMQCVCIPIGVVLSETVYHIYAELTLQIPTWITPVYVASASLIHMLCIVITVTFASARCSRSTVITGQRTENIRKSFSIVKIFIQIALAGAILVIILYLQEHLNNQTFIYAVRLLYFLVFLVLYNPIMLCVYQIVNWVCEKIGSYHMKICLKMCRMHWKKYKAIFFLMVYSCALFCGLFSMFENVRFIAEESVRNNIFYKKYEVYNGYVKNIEDNSIYETQRYRVKMPDGTGFYLTGIDDNYIQNFEDLRIVNVLGDTKIDQLLKQEDFRGIILPSEYISENDIGKEIVVVINDIPVKFQVYASFLTNDFERFDAYVSRSYLEKSLHKENYFNTVFYLADSYEEKRSGEMLISQTKDEMLKNSCQQAVNGTEDVELVVSLILTCAILSVVSCYVMSYQDTRRENAYMRYMGASRGVILKIFCLQAIWAGVISVIPAGVLTYVFSSSACSMILDPLYFSEGFSFDFIKVTGVVVVMTLISVAMQIYLASKGNHEIKKFTNIEMSS